MQSFSINTSEQVRKGNDNWRLNFINLGKHLEIMFSKGPVQYLKHFFEVDHSHISDRPSDMSCYANKQKEKFE